MRRSIPLLPLAAALLAAIPAAAAPNVDRLLSGVPDGKPEHCVRPQDIRNQTIVGPSTIIFERGGGRYYRNDVGPNCPTLSSDRAIITRQYTSDLCEGDIFQIADLVSHVGYGSCTFGPFVPFQRAPIK